MLTIAIQKSGRLNDDTVKLLKECGISIRNGGHNVLYATASNFPLKILYLRDDDIPECIADGAADIGIVGENEFLEKEAKLEIVNRLGFARCRLSIAIPKDRIYESLNDLSGLSIATSYPRILKTYLKKKTLNCSIRPISGSVEITPKIGMAEAIFDVVSTGSTLVSNGLREVETIMQSEAVLIASPSLDNEQQRLLDQLIFRIEAVKKARNSKYILLNAPNNKIDEISAILPGMKSPTIMPLVDKEWSSLHSVINEDDFWQNIENLKKAGAQGILVIPIEKMIV